MQVRMYHQRIRDVRSALHRVRAGAQRARTSGNGDSIQTLRVEFDRFQREKTRIRSQLGAANRQIAGFPNGTRNGQARRILAENARVLRELEQTHALLVREVNRSE